MSNKEILVRAFKTFLQAALGYIVTLSVGDVDWGSRTVLLGALTAAVAAGLSALMNVDWAVTEPGELSGEDGEEEDEE